MTTFSSYATTTAGAKAIKSAFPVVTNCPVYFLSDYVVGDGSTDDTTALNNAFALAAGISTGALFVMDCVCKITNTIVIGSNTGGAGTGPTSFISLICPGGAGSSNFRWAGPTDGRPAILFAKNKRFYVMGLSLQNYSSVGSSLGLQLGGDGGASDPGTETLDATFINCGVSSFNVGIQDGNFGDSSEITWINLVLDNCNTGWTSTGFNTLDHVFIMLSMSGCGIGLDSGAAEGFHVFGGSSSGATVCDFNVQSNGICDVSSFRNENSVNFVRGQGGSISLKNCNVLASALIGNLNTSVPGGVSITGSISRLAVESCQLNGWINLSSANNIRITDSVLQIDPASGLPLVFNIAAYGSISRLFLKNNQGQVLSGGVSVTPPPANDFDGFVTAGAVKSLTGGFENVPLLTPLGGRTAQPSISYLSAKTQQTYGVDYQALNFVRSLGEGPPGAVFTPSDISGTTSASAAAGTNQLTFSAVPSGIAPGYFVTDSTASGVIPQGTTILYFNTMTVWLSNNLTGAGVGSGDTINFYTPYGVTTTGKNLRVTGTFASSGTLSFTFTRNVTVNTGGSQNATLVAGSGNFFPTDVGKRIKIAGQGNQGWTDWFGFIAGYTDSTHVTVQPAGGQQEPSISAGGGGQTAVIGENEPDANYIVVGVVGNAAAPENYSVTSQSASGFTIVSSNASSTATVNCMLVR